jgi:phage terminase large subunit-like protein
MNNWHRLIWQLDAGTKKLNVYQNGKPNTFWLEPRVWSGATVKIETSKYREGELCYAVCFEGSNMKDMWRTVELFPAGTEPVELEAGEEAPLAGESTARLEGKIHIGKKTNIVSLFLDPADAKKFHIHVSEHGMYSPEGEDGWAQGNQH